MDCADTAFIGDGLLDDLSAALALTAAQRGFTVTEFTAKARPGCARLFVVAAATAG